MKDIRPYLIFFTCKQKRILSKTKLWYMYYIQKKSMQEIAFELKESKSAIYRLLHFYGIKRRRNRGVFHTLKEELEYYYWEEKKTIAEIAKFNSTSKSEISRFFKFVGVKTREPKEYSVKIIKRNIKFPTIPEERLHDILNENFPDEWKYVGNKNFYIGSKNPDFINIKTMRHTIDLFSSFWHIEFGRETEEERTKYFAERGYKGLVVWANELKKPEEIVEKVRKLTI